MLKRLLGAFVVAVGVGAALAAKLAKDQKKADENEEDNAVRFITLEDGNGLTQPSYDASGRAAEVQEVCGVYPYLNPDFVEELLSKANELNEKYEEDTLVTVTHHVVFVNSNKYEEFSDIMTAAGYDVQDENVSKRIFTADGAIVSDILNVANQAAVLGGEYQSYTTAK